MNLSRALPALAVGALTLLASAPAQACAVCFGRTDSPLGKGLHWGVVALLACIFAMLAAFGAFAVYLVRRSAAVAAQEAAESPETPTAQS